MIEPSYLRLRPQALSSLVLTCEHATNRLPTGTPRDAASRRVLDDHWGWDPGGWELTWALSDRFGASAVGGRWSRLYIDLNRPAGEATLVREEAGGVPLPWNRDLDPEEVERRLVELHAPYHDEIDRLLVRRVIRGIPPFIFAVHTFTPVYESVRRDFEAGVLFVDHEELARELIAGLQGAGVDTRANEPYSGHEGLMYAAERHGAHHRVPCLELEIRNDLLADEAGVARIAEAVGTALEPVLAQIEGGD